MTVKKLLIPFVLASLAGHALIIVLTARIDMSQSPLPEKMMKVELKTAKEVESLRPPPGRRQAAPQLSDESAGGWREDSVALQSRGGPYESYLLQIRRKIEGLWTYPPQAVSEKREGSAVIRFTIDADGSLGGYYVTSTSGSPILDEGALSVIRAASPFSALPAEFHLSRLHVTATFRYQINP